MARIENNNILVINADSDCKIITRLLEKKISEFSGVDIICSLKAAKNTAKNKNKLVSIYSLKITDVSQFTNASHVKQFLTNYLINSIKSHFWITQVETLVLLVIEVPSKESSSQFFIHGEELRYGINQLCTTLAKSIIDGSNHIAGWDKIKLSQHNLNGAISRSLSFVKHHLYHSY